MFSSVAFGPGGQSVQIEAQGDVEDGNFWSKAVSNRPLIENQFTSRSTHTAAAVRSQTPASSYQPEHKHKPSAKTNTSLIRESDECSYYVTSCHEWFGDVLLLFSSGKCSGRFHCPPLRRAGKDSIAPPACFYCPNWSCTPAAATLMHSHELSSGPHQHSGPVYRERLK